MFLQYQIKDESSRVQRSFIEFAIFLGSNLEKGPVRPGGFNHFLSLRNE